MVDSSQAVDEMTETLRQADGRVTEEPVDAESFEDRSGNLADSEGNDREIAWAGPVNAISAAAHRAARRVAGEV
jgi:hypothetical protein